MSLAERIAAARAAATENVDEELTLAQRIAAKRQAGQAPEIAPEIAPESDYEPTWQDRLGAYTQGATLGFGDEIGTALAATMAKMTGADEDWGDIYDSMMQSEQYKRDQYAEAAPIESMLLNLVGGVGTGGVTAAKAIPSTMKTLPKMLSHLGVAAGEGALAGFGSADQGERLEGAKEGALLGAALRGATGAAGKAAKGTTDFFTKRRIAQELATEDGFIPINVADPDSLLGKAYQTVQGRMFGSKIPEQTEDVIARMRPTVTAAKRAATREAADATTASKARQLDLGRARNKIYTDAKNQIDDIARDQTRNVRQERVLKEATSKADEATAIKQIETDFRKQALDQSLPPNVTPELSAELAELSPQQANARMSKIWKDGFSTVKGKTFTINPNQIIDDALGDVNVSGLDDYSADILQTLRSKISGKTRLPRAKKKSPFIYGKTTTKTPDTGKISGEDLMEARNTFRVALNEMKDKGASAQQREAFRRVAKRIDDVIEDNLSDAEKAIYRAERNAWGNYQSFRGSTGAAARTKQGEFGPSDWIADKKKAQGRRVEEGTAPLQQEAQDAQRAIENIKSQKSTQIDQIKTEADIDAERIRESKTQAGRGLDAAKKSMADRAKLRKIPETTPETTGLTYGAADDLEKSFRAMSPDADNLMGQKAAHFAAKSAVPIATFVGGPAAGLATLAAGPALSTPGVQRMLAGQLPTQKMIQEIISSYPGSQQEEIAQLLSQALRRQAVIQDED